MPKPILTLRGSMMSVKLMVVGNPEEVPRPNNQRTECRLVLRIHRWNQTPHGNQWRTVYQVMLN